MSDDRGPRYDLRGEVAVVTGGNGGIGLGIARALAEAGAHVAVWGRNPDKNAAALEQLEAIGNPAVAIRCDVSDEEQVSAALAETVDRLGSLDTMFANAGIGSATPFVDMTFEEWRRVIGVNLDGTFLSLRAAARYLVDRGRGGSLVAISSIVAVEGAPGLEHYAASKAGLLALVRSLAVELARHRVRCNSLLPGWTATDLNAEARKDARFYDTVTARTAVRRWAEPDDYAEAAVFLAGKEPLFHTGAELVVDGGYTIT